LRVEYRPAASRLESDLCLLILAKRHRPQDFRQFLRLPRPAYVKLMLAGRFPRTQVTTRLVGAQSQFFGPFPSRAAAERFESGFLDLFQLRRCQEIIEPSPHHPGCIYGEMNRCLRPCQQVVTVEEYRSEAARVSEFLSSRGDSLARSAAAARDKLSAELDFEAAARQHQFYERVQQVLRLRGELPRDIGQLHGVAVTPSLAGHSVELWFLLQGAWRHSIRFQLDPAREKPLSLDHRLRQMLHSLQLSGTPVAGREEHLAILSRWFHSSLRDGEWLPVEDPATFPYRKLVNAIHRIAISARPWDRPRGNTPT
jgi:excinuclease UvrABC nuclease subunit